MLIIYKNGLKFQMVGLELVREASDALKWKQIGFRLSVIMLVRTKLGGPSPPKNSEIGVPKSGPNQ